VKESANILLTGCSSPVALSLLPKLSPKVHIFCLVHTSHPRIIRPKFTILKSDLRDYHATFNSLSQIPKLDCIIHLAGITDAHVSLGKGSFKDNVSMAKTISRIVKEKSVNRLIYLSSNSVNYSQRQYAKNKQLSEEILKKTPAALTIFRPTLIISPQSQEIKNLHSLIRRLPFIPLVDQGRNLVYPISAQDVATAIFLSLNNEISFGKVYSLSNDTGITIRNIVESLNTVKHLEKPIINVPSWLVMFFLNVIGLIKPNYSRQVKDFILQPVPPKNSRTKRELGWIVKPITSQILTTSFR